MKLHNFFESAVDQNVDYRILSNRIVYDCEGRLESIKWLNNRFEKLKDIIDSHRLGKLQIHDNQELIKLTDEFAKWYNAFYRATDELMAMIEGNKQNLSPEADKMIKKALGPSAQLGFSQADLEAVFDSATTNFKNYPEMIQAIGQRATKYHRLIMKNESFDSYL